MGGQSWTEGMMGVLVEHMGKLVGDDDDFDFDNYDLMLTTMKMTMTMLTMCRLTNDDADGWSVFNSLC